MDLPAECGIRVLVVDDHPVMRLGVQRILARTAPDVVVEEAQGSVEALDRLRAGRWSLVLLDLVLPGRSGFEVLHDLRRLHPALPVVIFSMNKDEPSVVRALKQGAAGYLTKDCEPADLVEAVRKVAAGGRYVPPEIAELLVHALHSPGDSPLHESLSIQEYEILFLLAEGRSLRKIADELSISESSVSTYRSRVLTKLRLENNAQIIRYVLDNGLA